MLHFLLTNHQKDTKRQTVRVDTCYLILYTIEDNISKIKMHNSVLFGGVYPVLVYNRDHWILTIIKLNNHGIVRITKNDFCLSGTYGNLKSWVCSQKHHAIFTIKFSFLPTPQISWAAWATYTFHMYQRRCAYKMY